MRDRDYEEQEEPVTWEGQCGVCRTWFSHPQTTPYNPSPHGAFCPVCRKNGLMAVGVVHFKPAYQPQLEDL